MILTRSIALAARASRVEPATRFTWMLPPPHRRARTVGPRQSFTRSTEAIPATDRPSAYHSFFSASASVAGAYRTAVRRDLRRPHKMAGDRASAGLSDRSRFGVRGQLNTLIIALAALLPGENLAPAGVILSAIAISSITLASPDPRPPRTGPRAATRPGLSVSPLPARRVWAANSSTRCILALPHPRPRFRSIPRLRSSSHSS